MVALSVTNNMHQCLHSILIDPRTLLVLNLRQFQVIHNVCPTTEYTVKHGSIHKNREHQNPYQNYYYATRHSH